MNSAARQLQESVPDLPAELAHVCGPEVVGFASEERLDARRSGFVGGNGRCVHAGKIIGIVGADKLAEAWPLFKPYFRNFEERSGGAVTAEMLRADCMDGRRQCWAVVIDRQIRAVATTQRVADQVWVEHCAGQGRKDWVADLADAIEDWAGDRRVVVTCRTGWAPFLKARGYRETHRIMEKRRGHG